MAKKLKKQVIEEQPEEVTEETAATPDEDTEVEEDEVADVIESEDDEVEEEPEEQPKKKAAKKAPKVAKEKKVAPEFRGRAGKTSGKPVAIFWTELMAANFKAKLTDDELAEKMREEFPEQKPYNVNDVRLHRRLFNMGKIKHMTAAPDQVLPEFGSDRKPLVRVRTAPKRKKSAESAEEL